MYEISSALVKLKNRGVDLQSLPPNIQHLQTKPWSNIGIYNDLYTMIYTYLGPFRVRFRRDGIPPASVGSGAACAPRAIPKLTPRYADFGFGFHEVSIVTVSLRDKTIKLRYFFEVNEKELENMPHLNVTYFSYIFNMDVGMGSVTASSLSWMKPVMKCQCLWSVWHSYIGLICIYLYTHIYIYTYIHTLHYTTLHYITIHYITIQYIHTLHTYIHIYIYIYINTYIHLHIYIYTYIHIYIYTYIHIYIYTYIYTYIHIYIFTYLHIYIYTYLHIYIYTYVHMYICTYIHIYIFTYIHIYIYTYIHTYIRTYVHIYIYTYIHIYIYTYIHIYIHTYIFTYTHTHIHIHIHIHTHIHTHIHIHQYSSILIY